MGYRLSKIYTRTGDNGDTGLADGRRVAKNHARIEAIGEVDTLNCHLGLLLAELSTTHSTHPALTGVSADLSLCQHRLFDLGGELAMPEYQALDSHEIQRIEQLIDHWNSEVGPLTDFILPGGSITIAQAHLCRSAARSAERRAITLHQLEPLRSELLIYLNRLSDLLFVAARVIAKRQTISEVLWQAAPAPNKS
ncbi:cob(I)yrinic acid a,c-diamide adenosyltransferase [Thiopseudomonas alkaliphila]|uniref:cob(I)yrinic acid a,c-diamide adenosyltransferase n=1 Tax=Thiopseudomonas alkaliphila TaxID=1697053 RepID=UPI0025757EAF|nr:cob(I)yrinic acid a,c-diamide adenosyltransferase [Thiopseudomonas alkaliphila]MDM1717022.1 cob(I)yrinic acid a,c-diamide adenosyltransferase [Thiopseudomonas alkaliphila]